MKLERSVITISMTDDNRGSFKLIDSIRPNHISFSQFLGVAANEYYLNNKDVPLKITDFTNKDIVAMPMFYSEIEQWMNFIKAMPQPDIKKFQKRHRQLGNIIDKRIEGIIS